ncbi:MAG: hypothetical protein AB1635_05060 [Acidobacteriota bacterium]
MTELSPIAQADPLALPAPIWLLWTLLLITFVLHVVPMNLVLGGSILTAIARLRAARDPHQARLVQIATPAMPVAIAATVTFGVAPLLFVQVLYGRLFFTSSVLMAWWWLGVVLLVLAAYYGAYVLAYGRAVRGAAAWVIGGLMAAAFILVAFIYSNNMTLMLRPDLFVGRFLADQHGTGLSSGDPTLWPRYLHMVFGALAVAGLALARVGTRRERAEPTFAAWAMRTGSRWAAWTTAANVLTGVWWFGALPPDIAARLQGGDVWATVTFVIGLLAGVAVLGLLVAAAVSARPAPHVRSAVHAMLLTIVLMVVIRDQVRQGALQAAGYQPATWIEPQWSAIGIFVALLLVAVASVVWMASKLSAADGLRPR